MSFHPKISIIIPVYNGANYLRESIESALAQTYNNIEVLVVNDGSKDNGKTREIALSFENRIRYFEKENGGVATALNLGIQKMAGEYFSWLSHDDVYYPYKLEAQVDYLRHLTSKEVILYGDYDLIDCNSQYLREMRLPHYEPDIFLYELSQRSFIHGCTLLIPKICFECVGQFNEKLLTTQDYELWIKLSKHYVFIHLSKKLIKSRCHSEQGSNQAKALHLEEDDQLHVLFIKELLSERIPHLYNIPASQFYLKLGKIYQHRQLLKATYAAKREAIKLAKGEGISAYVKTVILSNIDSIKLKANFSL